MTLKGLACYIFRIVLQLVSDQVFANTGPEPAEPLLDRKTISLLVNSIFMPDFESCKVISFSRSTEVNYASEEYFELPEKSS